jgi:predicted NUDIX family NTP pyrophosphohydrolase
MHFLIDYLINFIGSKKRKRKYWNYMFIGLDQLIHLVIVFQSYYILLDDFSILLSIFDVMNRKITCGIFIFDNTKKFLICHPTGSKENEWSIPKGLPNKDENYFIATLRECKEETNLDLQKLSNRYFNFSIFLGGYIYQSKRKVLKAFSSYFKTYLNHKNLKCNSLISLENPIPEIDKFKWVSIEEGKELIRESQKRALNKLLEKKEFLVYLEK